MNEVQSICIIGAGESGVGAAHLAVRLGCEVFVTDAGFINQKYKEELISLGVSFEEGGHSIEKVLVTDLVIKSPGVPDDTPLLRSLYGGNRRVISEIEFGFMFYSGLTIAITGSNGKTTTAGLLYHVLKTGGLDVGLSGNYGISFCRMLAQAPPQYMVLEMSSFQLDQIETFAPYVGILLNITPDHLDRYAYDMSKYAAAKFKIVQNSRPDTWFIYNADDSIIKPFMTGLDISAQSIGIHMDNVGQYLVRKDTARHFDLVLEGVHNQFNAACVIAAARICGLSDTSINQGLATFKNLPHRLERVAEYRGVLWINDSKATNVDAVYFALDSMSRPVVWICGGTDKGNDYGPLMSLVSEKVRALVYLGIDNSKLIAQWRDHSIPYVESHSMSDAVMQAERLAHEGDVVLLSPACASFDLFKNYMDRGDQFKEAVYQIVGCFHNN